MAVAGTMVRASGPTHPEDRPPRRVYDNVAQLVGDPDNPTPMVRLSERFDPDGHFDLFIKLERNNPFGSIKDRTALYLLNGTPLREGQVLTEPTAGNTGIALAALANARGMPIELALPDGTPEEKKALLRFLGAGLLEVEDELCPLFPTEGARGVVKSLVFGVVVTWIALFEGYDATPTSEGVSRATTRTVVHSALAVLCLDFVLTALMFGE